MPADAAPCRSSRPNFILRRGSARMRGWARSKATRSCIEAVTWTDGEFEIDFGASSDRTTTTRSTTGLLMEAMRLMDEADSNQVES